MTKYSVKQLSELAGITVRTLHHYDDLGLLEPAYRTEKGYRYYGRDELLKLQQILFYRELGLNLTDINALINDPEFDTIKALKSHRVSLTDKVVRLKTLIGTVDKTINDLKTKNHIMEDKDMYEGFTREQVDSMRKEVKERWGEDELLKSENNVKALGKEGWKKHQEKGDQLTRTLAELMGKDPASEEVQTAIEAYHKEYLNLFYEVSKERLRGLGAMYVSDPRFRAHYDAYAEGLADFVNSAIIVYCDNGTKSK